MNGKFDEDLNGIREWMAISYTLGRIIFCTFGCLLNCLLGYLTPCTMDSLQHWQPLCFLLGAANEYVLQFQQAGDIGFLLVVKTTKQIYNYYKSKFLAFWPIITYACSCVCDGIRISFCNVRFQYKGNI